MRQAPNRLLATFRSRATARLRVQRNRLAKLNRRPLERINRPERLCSPDYEVGAGVNRSVAKNIETGVEDGRRYGWLGVLCLTFAPIALPAQLAMTGPRANSPTHSAYDTYAAHSPSAQVQVVAAQQLYSDGDYNKAARRLEAAVKEEPGNSGLLDELGVIYERIAEGAAIPSFNQGRAEKAFRRSMAADGNDPRPVEHLISLLLDPPNQCRGDLHQIKPLIQRLATLDPVAAQEARQHLEWTTSELPTLAEKFVCAPHRAVEIVKRALPQPKFVTTTP
jgi:hypothetical protein